MSINMIVPLEVGIACRDLPRLQRFYQEIMGFNFVSEIVVSSDKAAQSGLSSASYTVVRLQTNYGERIKLLGPTTPPAPVAAAPYILDNPNATYLTFIVDEIDIAMRNLQQAGVEFMTGNDCVEVRSGVCLAFCRDPEGNVLELVQYDDISAYRTDLKKGND